MSRRKTTSVDSKRQHSSVEMSVGPGANCLGVVRVGRRVCLLMPFLQDTDLWLPTIVSAY